MHFVLLATLALGSPSEPADTVASNTEVEAPTRSGAIPGTVGSPLRLRVTGSAIQKANGTIQREWDKVERALLDLQYALYGDADRRSRNAGLEPGKPLRVRVDDGIRVRLEVLESDHGWRNLRLQFEDDRGSPVEQIERATVQTPGSEERELDLASSSEVVIEDLQYAPGSAVRLYIGDGEVVVIWLEEVPEEDQ